MQVNCRRVQCRGHARESASAPGLNSAAVMRCENAAGDVLLDTQVCIEGKESASGRPELLRVRKGGHRRPDAKFGDLHVRSAAQTGPSCAGLCPWISRQSILAAPLGGSTMAALVSGWALMKGPRCSRGTGERRLVRHRQKMVSAAVSDPSVKKYADD